MIDRRDTVCVSSYGPGAGSTRVRLYDWFRHIAVVPEYHGYLGASDNAVRRLVRAAPRVARAEWGLHTLRSRLAGRTLVLGRQASPFSRGRLEERLLRGAQRSTYDFDDALYADTARVRARVWSRPRMWRRAVSSADTVVAGSDILAEAASRFSTNVVVIPSCIEPDDYVVKHAFERTGSARAVWIGSPATEPYLRTLTSPLLAMHQRSGLRLSVVSAGQASLGALDAMVDRVAWTPEGFAAVLAEADFGVMPLPDSPYARGKCAYKLLQYAAAGLPLVGSPVGANELALDRLGGFSASSDAQWEDAMCTIIDASAQQCRQWGRTAREQVITHYSFSSWKSRWLRATGIRT